MSDLKLNEQTGDLVIANGDLSLTTGADATKQRLSQRLKAFVGEWFLDLSDGTPYFQQILGQKIANLNDIEAIFIERISNTPGVIEVLSFEMSYDRQDRALIVSGEVRSIEGNVEFNETLGV